MTNKIKTLIAAGAVLASAAVLAPQKADAATGAGTASATVLAALTVTEVDVLSFGSFEASASAGTVVIAPTTGSRNVTGGVTAGPDLGGDATFDITGTASASISISVSTGVNLTGTGADMPVAFDITGAPAALDGTGNATVSVGATLTVNASQAAGAYSGGYTVTVLYN